GSEFVTLIQTEIPIHTHNAGGDFNQADLDGPTANTVYTRSTPGNAYQTNSTANLTTMAPQMISVTGSSFPHNNMMPYLTVTFVIALQGVFPPRT
ncbi:MAG: phage tail protein, partial [Thermoanaerobaculia bacterium]